MVRIGFVGCGYVADFYAKTLEFHPHLALIGVCDRRSERAAQFGKHYGVPVYQSYEEMLADPTLDIVVNLTNPRSHYAVSKAALEAGKHVYSEKPLAMEFTEAKALVALAKEKNLYLSSAPCSMLGESAQTVWKALRDGVIGQPYLVYAELDDGLIHRNNYKTWITESGSPWPYIDEFETGCTLEHAGYYVTWLTAFFGPAKAVTAYAACVVKDKQTDTPLTLETPDFSVGCLEFASGVVARITCSIVVEHNHKLTIAGEEGTLTMDEAWDYRSPVYREPIKRNLRRERIPVLSQLLGYGRNPVPFAKDPNPQYRKSMPPADFSKGVAELAHAISEARPCRLSAEHALHVNEIVLTLQNPQTMGSPRIMETTFPAIAPMPWAL
ncbi:MAG: Gfo/Idh/MocA family oxidoreductase [Caldilineaceae bacterium]|nr:Gfo/Idh/MocA family oxidoreductase [Caldilineaceae bacterium]